MHMVKKDWNICGDLGVSTVFQSQIATWFYICMTSFTSLPQNFFSEKLNDAQQRYSTYDPEFLAAYKSVKHFRYILEGREVFILTDHKPLQFAFNLSHSRRILRKSIYRQHC